MSTRAIQATVHDDSQASLQLVAREISAELNEARVALEAYAEQPDDRSALHRFAAHVHLARGALRLAEVYGGALLAEEMEHVARYVDSHSGAEMLSLLRRSVDEFGQTIVMVTHDPVAAAVTDRVVFLADGKVVDEMGHPTRETVLGKMQELTADYAPAAAEA